MTSPFNGIGNISYSKYSLAIVSLLFAVSSNAQDKRQNLLFSTGDEKWQESRSFLTNQNFYCGKFYASYRSSISREKGLEDLELIVEGKPVPAQSLKAAKLDIVSSSGFDFVSFSCTTEFYRFAFFKNETNGGQTIVTSVTGKI